MKRLPRKRYEQLVRHYNKGMHAKQEMNMILYKHCTSSAYNHHSDYDDMDWCFADPLEQQIYTMESMVEDEEVDE